MLNTSHFVRRIHPALAAVITIGSLAGCQGQHSDKQRASAETATLRAGIDALRSEYEKAVAAGDPNAIAALLAEGAVMVPPGGPDWDAMFAAASGAPFPPGARIEIRPIEVVVLSKEWAYEFGTATTTYTPKGADEARQLRDTYLILFRNASDGWKAYREVASSNPPPQGWPER
jgi:uncharacterized protein (TIGR02246 family)